MKGATMGGASEPRQSVAEPLESGPALGAVPELLSTGHVAQINVARAETLRVSGDEVQLRAAMFVTGR